MPWSWFAIEIRGGSSRFAPARVAVGNLLDSCSVCRRGGSGPRLRHAEHHQQHRRDADGRQTIKREPHAEVIGEPARGRRAQRAAVLFIAQIFHIDFSVHRQIAMLLILMVTSKGMAGVPRASLMVIASTLTYFGLPEQGLVLIIAVDHLLDMGRSATNVVGNAVASILVAK